MVDLLLLLCVYAISSTSDKTKTFAKIFTFYFRTNLRLDNNYQTPKIVKNAINACIFVTLRSLSLFS